MKIPAPKTKEKLQEFIKQNIAEGKTVVPCGFGTRTGETGVPVLTKELNKVLFFRPEDMVIGLEAGITVAELSKVLAEKGMFVPFEPEWHETTLGSLICMNDKGPRACFSGGIRDFIIGLEYIDDEGEFVKAGGKVVKNVTGYDLMKMVTGSRGIFGALTGVNLRLVPVPAGTTLVGIEFGNINAALEVLNKLNLSGLPFDGYAMEINSKTVLAEILITGNDPRRKTIEAAIKAFNSELAEPGTWKKKKGDLIPEVPGGFLETFLTKHGLERKHVIGKFLMPTSTFSEFRPAPPEKDTFLLCHPIGATVYLISKAEDEFTKKAETEKIVKALDNKSDCFYVPYQSDGFGPSEKTIPRVAPHAGIYNMLKNSLDKEKTYHNPFVS